MKKNGITLIITSVLLSFVITAIMNNNADNSNKIKSKSLFLMFPTDESYAYKTKSLNELERLDKIERAITVSSQDIRSKVAKIIMNEKEDAYAKLSTFRYLPSTDYERYIVNWKKYLYYQGYSSGEFRIAPSDSKSFSITIILKDSKHARQHEYRYNTDGIAVFDIRPIGVTSGLGLVKYAVTYIMVLLFVVITLNLVIGLASIVKSKLK